MHSPVISKNVIESEMERSGRESNPQNREGSRFIRSLGLADAQPLHSGFSVNLTGGSLAAKKNGSHLPVPYSRVLARGATEMAPLASLYVCRQKVMCQVEGLCKTSENC
jgi:hypothetical protein